MSNVYLSTSQVAQQTTQPATGIKPLAQSFVVDTPGGAFVTSIDLYFYAKDNTLPVTVELRAMENGVPSGVIVPFSTVSVSSANVNVSTNASLATRFTFAAPIYLLDTAEYCFVVNSNSRSYLLWVSQIGGRDVTNTTFTIAKQPYVGVMFRSQNTAVWTPDQNFDIKFKMNRAEFVTSGNLILNESTIDAIRLDSNPLCTYATNLAATSYTGTSTTIVQVNIASTTGIVPGDQITISDETGLYTSALNGHWTITEVNSTNFKFDAPGSAVPNGSSYAVAGKIVLGSKTIRVYHKDNGHFAGVSKVTIYGATGTVNGIPASEINGEHDVVLAEQDSYTFNVATTASNAAGRCGGDMIAATENRVFDTLYTNIQQLGFQKTNSNWFIRTTSGKSLAGLETPHILGAYSQIPVNTNVNMNNPMVVKSSTLSNTTKSFYLKGELTTTNPALSPVIDLNRTSIITINNRIDNPAASAASGYNAVDNYRAETAAVGSSALAKYITRRIDLDTPASALKMYITTNRPPGSRIVTYFKGLTLQAGSDANFDSIGWTLVPPTIDVPITSNSDEYTEVEFEVTEAMIGDQFTAFAIKVVFLSDNSSKVPSCRSFRAIAVT